MQRVGGVWRRREMKERGGRGIKRSGREKERERELGRGDEKGGGRRESMEGEGGKEVVEE